MKKNKRIYRGKIVDLRVESHRLPNGHEANFEVVRHAPAAAVVPIDGDTILMIRQYRVPVRKYLWEIPAGLVEKGETPLACVKREMIEETGYVGKNYRKLISIYTTAGFSNEIIHLYKCEVSRKASINHESSEVIEVHRMPASKVKKMLHAGKITDAKTLVALSYAF